MTLKNKNSIENKLNQPLFSLSPNATVKISLWHLISDPFKLLIQNWQNLFLFGIPIALILSFSSIMFKHPFVCLTDKESSLTSPLCSDDFEYYYINLLIRIILIMFFATKWFHFSILKNTFSLKNIFLLHKGDFKGIGTIILFVLINLSPLIGLFILFLRDPNPNWKIELLFFTSVAWIFLVPIIAIRFYSLVSFAFCGIPFPSFKTIWISTRGNMLKLLLATSVIVLFFLIIFTNYFGAIQNINSFDFLTALSTEFEYNVLVILFVAYSLNFCNTQRELLFGRFSDEQY